MPHFAVTAVGIDRPGIVASVSGVLVEHGCNLEDTSMSILRGHFTMMLLVAVPPDLTPAALEAGLADACAALDLVITVRAIDDEAPAPQVGQPWTVSVYGADRPGLVHRVATVLGGFGVNIVDLTTRVVGETARPSYFMVLEVTIPAGVDPAGVRAALSEAGAELGVECSMHPSEADVF
ncbi:MAG: glycine cleavage system protein R [Acidimicrobiales bacterium]